MSDPTRNAILDTLHRRERAIHAGDAPGAVADMDADMVDYAIAPPLAVSGDAARDPHALQAWLDTWDGPVRAELDDAPSVRSDGDLAVVHGLLRIRGIKRGEGPVDVWTRSTTVLARRDGRWRIVHEHGSFPMRMDGSSLAATDLVP